MFKKLLEKLLIAPANIKKFDINEYIQSIETGRWQNLFVFGVAEHEKDFMAVDLVQRPGALYFGGMGSGKSTAMKFSMITRFLSNSEHDIYILMDPAKGMTDYKTLFPYRGNVALALDDASKIIALVDMLYEEVMARREAFNKVQASDIYKYEELMRKKNPSFKLARIMICFEEFHMVINSEALKFAYKCDTEGTAANKFLTLLKISRSYGLGFFFGNQRASSESTPSSLKTGITTFLGFKVNNPGDAAVANLPLAAEIPSNLRGRCVTENGYMQFPFLPDVTAEKLLKKYYRPLKAQLLKYKIEDFQKALEGEGNEGLVLIKPYKEILDQLYSINTLDVCMRFLRTFDFEVSKQGNPALAVQLIAQRDGKKYAVMCIKQRNQTSDKSLESFRQGADILECDNAIIMSNEQLSSGSVLNNLKATFKSVIMVDGEDLNRISEVLDNKNLLEEEGNFENLFNKLALAKKDKTAENPESADEDEDDLELDLKSIRAKLRNDRE
jgi:hypothetical protein